MAELDSVNDIMVLQDYTIVDGSSNLVSTTLTELEVLRAILNKLEEIRVMLATDTINIAG